MRKLFTFLIALVASANMMFAESGTCGDNLSWDLTDGVLTISGTGAMTDFKLNGAPWNAYRANITSLTIGNSVTSIGNYAFYKCSGLTSVTIPGSVINIGKLAFQDCSQLTSVTIGNSVTSIGDQAFYSCTGLKSIEIPNSVISIGVCAFALCSGLTSVTIPNSVINIGDYAFKYCSKLTSIIIPENVTSIGAGAFCGCSHLTGVTIPSSVTSIGKRAFSDCDGLKSIVVEGGNSKYDSRNNCNAIIETLTNTLVVGCKTTTIPNSVTSIGDDAFNRCSGLTSIIIPENVTSIGEWAFYGCSGLTGVTIPISVTSIGVEAFLNCAKISSIVIPKNATSIGPNAFSDCDSLISIDVDEENSEYCSKEGVLLNKGKDILIQYPIGRKDTTYIIPPMVTKIEAGAFSYCKNLTSIEIPETVSNIGVAVFMGCSNLTSITCHSVVPPILIGSQVFDGVKKSIPLYVPAGSVEAYKAAEGWKDLTNIQPIAEPAPCLIASGTCGDNLTWELSCDSVLTISGTGAMTAIPWSEYKGAIKEVHILEGVTTIANSAFYQCTGMTSVVIPNGIISIGVGAFIECTNLVNISIPGSVTSIGNFALTDCAKLLEINVSEDNPSYSSINGVLFNKNQTILIQYPASKQGDYVIPNSVTSIGDDAFRICSKLTNITIPNEVKTIGADAFYSCNNLKGISLPKSVTSIGIWAFAFCSSLDSVTIPEGITSIEAHAFYFCSALTSVTIPNSVINIGDYAFQYCSKLTDLTCEAVTPPTCGKYVLYGVNKAIPLYVPAGSVEAYKAADQWKDFTNIQPIAAPCLIASGYCGAEGDSTNLTWELSCDRVLTISGTGKMADYGYDHRTPWYAYKDTIEAIILPDGITNIGNHAFGWCEALSSVRLPNSVTEIGQRAFVRCRSMTSCVLPNSLKTIAYYAFADCQNLQELIIPKSVRNISREAFPMCGGLTSILVEEGNPYYDSRENSNALISTTTNTLFRGCKNTIIPNSITSISEYAFTSSKGLISIEIPNSVTNIGYGAFELCEDLESIIIPNSVTSMESNAFASCEKLKSVVLSNQLKSIHPNTFSKCSNLESIVIPNNVTKIEVQAFSDCEKLTSITLGNKIDTIYKQSFWGCGLTSIDIPKSVKYIGSYAFYKCSKLDTIFNRATTPQGISNDVFLQSIKSKGKLYVPAESVDLYKAADQWKDFTNIQPIEIHCPEVPVTTEISASIYEGEAYRFGQSVLTESGIYRDTLSTIEGCDSIIKLTLSVLPIPSYTVSVHTNNTQYGVVVGGGTFKQGTKITIAAVPAEEHYFVRWSDGDMANPRSLVVSRDSVLTAFFAITKYNLTAEPNDPMLGSVSGGGEFQKNERATLIANPYKGCQFVRWSDGRTLNPRTVKVYSDTTLMAIFKSDKPVIPENTPDTMYFTSADTILRAARVYSPYDIQAYDKFIIATVDNRNIMGSQTTHYRYTTRYTSGMSIHSVAVVEAIPSGYYTYRLQTAAGRLHPGNENRNTLFSYTYGSDWRFVKYGNSVIPQSVYYNSRMILYNELAPRFSSYRQVTGLNRYQTTIYKLIAPLYVPSDPEPIEVDSTLFEEYEEVVEDIPTEITPQDTIAVISTPYVEFVYTFTIIIWADAEHTQMLLMLTFNSDGQLVATTSPHAIRRGTRSTDINFEIADLLPETEYYYSLMACDDDGSVLKTVHDSFTTKKTATSIDEINASNTQPVKLLKQGQLYILRDGEVYNATGARVE